MYGELAALARQLEGRDFLAVQRVGNLHVKRQRLGGIALIGDLRAVRRPDNRITVAGERLVAGQVFNVGQAGNIANLIFACGIVQPLAHDRLVRIAVCIGEHIDDFLFIHLGQRARRNAHQHRQREHGRPNALYFALHNQFSSFLTFMPRVVCRIRPSHSIRSAGRIRMTHSIEMIAPRAIRLHMELMISISE